MSSSDSEVSITTIRPNLPIPELIKSIKHSFRECEFNEVQNILMDREKNMKNEIENLERDLDSIKEEVRLLERTQGLAELEKLKFEQKLQMSKIECEELKEKVTRLIEDQRLSRDREKRAEDRYAKVCDEHSKMANEKNKIILELNKKINEFKNKKMEAADQTVVELRRENLEAGQTIEQLKRQKLEAEKASQLHKNRFENLASRITKAEEALASMLNLKVDGIANLVNDKEKSAAAEEDKNLNFPDCEGRKESLGSGTAQGGGNADSGKLGVKLSGVTSASNSAGNGCSGLSKKGLHASDFGLDGRATVREKLMSEAGCSNKMVVSSAAAGDIIEISDSDDEINPARAAYISDICADMVKKEMICEQSPPRQKNKLNGTDCREGSLTILTPKRKRNMHGSDDDNLPINGQKEKQILEMTRHRFGFLDSDHSVNPNSEFSGLPPLSHPVFKCESQTLSQKFNGFNDKSSTDSEDESCSDSYMDNFVATIQSQSCRKWKFGADVLNAFQEDTELCMNAVCALYRQKSKSGGFSRFDAMSGHALAEYLIDGDPELRLRKSVSEVKQENPNVISQCKKLATRYYEKLFEIYCNAEDPFFGKT